jgi:hypothetical protein
MTPQKHHDKAEPPARRIAEPYFTQPKKATAASAVTTQANARTTGQGSVKWC